MLPGFQNKSFGSLVDPNTSAHTTSTRRKDFMRTLKWTSLSFVATTLALVLGCSQSDSGESVAQNDFTAPQQAETRMDSQNSGQTVTANKVAENADDTMEATGELASQTKDEYVRELREQLAELDRKMADLQQRAGNLQDDAKAEWQQTWDNLQARREQMKQEMSELQSSSGDAWQDLREGTSSAWGELQQAFERAQQQFNDAIPADAATSSPAPADNSSTN